MHPVWREECNRITCRKLYDFVLKLVLKKCLHNLSNMKKSPCSQTSPQEQPSWLSREHAVWAELPLLLLCFCRMKWNHLDPVGSDVPPSRLTLEARFSSRVPGKRLTQWRFILKVRSHVGGSRHADQSWLSGRTLKRLAGSAPAPGESSFLKQETLCVIFRSAGRQKFGLDETCIWSCENEKPECDFKPPQGDRRLSSEHDEEPEDLLTWSGDPTFHFLFF